MKEKWIELQSYRAISKLTIGITLLIVGIIVSSFGIAEVMSTKKPAIDLETITDAQCKSGLHVKTNVEATLGYMWESVDLHNGVEQDYTRKRIYLIPYGTEGKFIGINVQKLDFDAFEQLAQDTYGNVEVSSIGNYEGYLKKCDKRMIRVLEDEFGAYGESVSYTDYVMPYYIELYTDTSSIMLWIACVFLLLGVVFIAIVFPIECKKEAAERKLGASQYIGQVIFDYDKEQVDLQIERMEQEEATEETEISGQNSRVGDIDIYAIYSATRRKSMLISGIASLLVCILIPVIGGFHKGAFENMFYGINRVYLLIIFAVWLMFLTQVYCFVTKWDKRKIQKAIHSLGIFEQEFLAELSQGRFFCQSLKTEGIYISQKYSLIGAKGSYTVIRTMDIQRIGVDVVKRGDYSESRMHCLLKDGRKFVIVMNQDIVERVCGYLKELMKQTV